MFADDTILFLNGYEASIQGLMRILSGYKRATGQLVNTSKSSFMVAPCTTINTIRRIQDIKSFSRSNLPFDYLGCPIFSERTRVHYFERTLGDMEYVRTQLWIRILNPHFINIWLHEINSKQRLQIRRNHVHHTHKEEREISSPFLLLSFVSSCVRVCAPEGEELFSPYPLSLERWKPFPLHASFTHVLFLLLSSHLSLFSLSYVSLYYSPSHPPLRPRGQKKPFFLCLPFALSLSLSLSLSGFCFFYAHLPAFVAQARGRGDSVVPTSSS